MTLNQKFYFTTFLILLLCPSSYAQFVNYNNKDGLSFHTVDHISEDDEGFIYTSTNEGLNIFDGNKFTLFNANNTVGFSNHIQLTLPLKKGFLLIGSKDKGVYILNKYTQSIISLSFNTNEIKKELHISSLYVDKNDMIWVGCENGLLFTFQSSEINSKISKNKILDATVIVKNSGSIKTISPVGEALFIGGNGSTITRIKRVNTKYVLDHPIQIRNASTIHHIIQIKNKLLIGTNNGLYKIENYNLLTNENRVELNEPWKLKDNIIRTISVQNDNLWIGTEGNGLFEYDLNGALIEHFLYSENKRNSLDSNYVLYSYIDSNNNLWLGTWFGGIDILNLNETNATFIYDQANENNLFSNIIWVIEELPNGQFFLGTHGNGLCLYDPKDKNFKSVLNSEELKSIQSLYYDKASKLLYIGTWGYGIKIYDPLQSKLIESSQKFSDLANHRIYSIEKDSFNQLWIGSFSNGLYKYSPKLNNLEKIQIPDNAWLNSSDIRSIVSDSNNNQIWIGSVKNGLYCLNLSNTGEINEIEHISDSEQMLSVRNLYKDTVGDLWVAYENGIIKIDTNYQFDKLPLINSSTNTAITKDKKNNLWVGTYNGLYMIAPGYNNSPLSVLTSLTVYDLKFNTKRNVMLVASEYGLVKVDLNFKPIKPFFPKLVLTNLNILDQLVIPNKKINGKIILNQKLNYNDTIILPHFSETFSMDINALSFGKNNKEKIRYKLTNFEELWNETNNIETTVTYTNLPPGTYQLIIQVANEDNLWNPVTKNLTIIKQRPWWATYWAYAAYIFIFSTLIYWITKVIYGRAKIAQELRIEKIEKEKEYEMHQQKLSFFTTISHELRSPLTLIISPLEEMVSSTKADDKMQIKLQRMLKNGKMLLNLVNKILDFRKAETNNLTLNLKQINIKDFVQSIYYQFHELAENKTIDLEIFYLKKELIIAADPEKLESILFNLLTNAIKFTPRYGHIIIYVTNDDKTVSIGVKDTGIGIPKNEIATVFSRFHQAKKDNKHLNSTGIGLSLVKKYAELHNGNVEVKSIENLGTEFIVQLPILSEIENYDKHIIHNDTEVSLLPTPEIEITEPSKKKESILVIDDNDDIRNYLIEILEENYRIYAAENGKEALTILNKKMPDLVITDIMMEGMDGLEVCQHIKSNINTSHIPVIMLTAKNTVEAKIEGFEKGGDAYIEKPFNSKLLLARVKTLIHEREILKKKFLLTEVISDENTPTSVDQQFVENIIAKIEEHISESEFSVQALTESINMSQDQLYRKTKALTGLSINHFIRMIRIKRAARLLREGKYSVSEVLYMVGFNNPSYFSKCFKSEFGITPSDYLEKNTIKSTPS